MGRKKQSYEVVKLMVSKNLPAALGRVVFWIPSHLLPLAGLIFIVLIFFRVNAPGLGKIAGVAVGSFEGVASGIAEGAKEGKETGLSAKDVEVRLGNEMKETEKLQILLVDMKLSDIYQHGETYAALLSLEGEAAFTVDLALSQITLDGEKFIIEIPEPEFELYLDDSTIEVLDEYQRKFFNGSAKDGYTGYLNSREEVQKRAKEEMADNEAMLKQAKASALRQVEELAKAICGKHPLEIHFSEREE